MNSVGEVTFKSNALWYCITPKQEVIALITFYGNEYIILLLRLCFSPVLGLLISFFNNEKPKS